jgi:alpha-tubulin suppressor-like RCC1 family protein
MVCGGTAPGLEQVTAAVWGYNNAGGLGLGHTARAYWPVPAHLPAGIVDVQGGTDFTVALTSSGQVWAWGGNRHGQIGDGLARPRLSPYQVAVPGNQHVTAIAAGKGHVLASTRDGHVLAWGRNTHGQLGDGTLTDRATPVEVPVSGIFQVAAGNSTSVAITDGGGVLTWGLGTGHAGAGAPSAAPGLLTLPEGVTAAAADAGDRHIVVLASNGELRTFGVDPAGKPLPESMPLDRSWGDVESISAGDNHTVALTGAGVVLAWGANYRGQLGTGDTVNRAVPVVVHIPGLQGRVVQLVAGGDSVLARTEHGGVYSWGYGAFGQNGNGLPANQTRPIPVETPADMQVTSIYAGRYHCLTTTRHL